MTNKQRAIQSCINEAIDNFNANEQYLISRDLSERCICAKFMSYLERAVATSEFFDYVVDVEYNRGNYGNEQNAKKLEDQNIVVDLIVHKRGYNDESGFDNLICIEMKKAYTYRDLTADKDRLRKLTDIDFGFGYRAGYMIVAVANKRSGEYKLQIESQYLNVMDY